jgi:hypothetical protein
VTDPDCRLEVAVKDEAALSRYQFALRTSEFLVCAQCGVFVDAVMEHDGRTFVVREQHGPVARVAP